MSCQQSRNCRMVAGAYAENAALRKEAERLRQQLNQESARLRQARADVAALETAIAALRGEIDGLVRLNCGAMDAYRSLHEERCRDQERRAARPACLPPIPNPR